MKALKNWAQQSNCVPQLWPVFTYLLHLPRSPSIKFCLSPSPPPHPQHTIQLVLITVSGPWSHLGSLLHNVFNSLNLCHICICFFCFPFFHIVLHNIVCTEVQDIKTKMYLLAVLKKQRHLFCHFTLFLAHFVFQLLVNLEHNYALELSVQYTKYNTNSHLCTFWAEHHQQRSILLGLQ